MTIKEAYDELEDVLKRELGLMPSIQIFFHSVRNVFYDDDMDYEKYIAEGMLV